MPTTIKPHHFPTLFTNDPLCHHWSVLAGDMLCEKHYRSPLNRGVLDPFFEAKSAVLPLLTLLSITIFRHFYFVNCAACRTQPIVHWRTPCTIITILTPQPSINCPPKKHAQRLLSLLFFLLLLPIRWQTQQMSHPPSTAGSTILSTALMDICI